MPRESSKLLCIQDQGRGRTAGARHSRVFLLSYHHLASLPEMALHFGSTQGQSERYCK